MAITFKWSVKDMHKVDSTGAVYKVDWSCSGVDEDTGVSHSKLGTYQHMSSIEVDAITEEIPEITKVRGIGSEDETTTIVYPARTEVIKEAHTKLVPTHPDATAEGFTPYTDLTEETVLGWCKANGVEAETESHITTNINNKLAATATSTGLPWAAE